MPRQVDPAAHDTHDAPLVAAYAAGDAAGADLAAATALVATCHDCAALHRDLRAIAAALPELPAPTRPRDFRITAELASSIRPAGWRGVLATLAGPRFRFAAPLGSGLAALGLVGILLGSLAGLPLGAGGATAGRDAAMPEGAYSAQAPAPAPAATAAPTVVGDVGVGAAAGQSEAPAADAGSTATGEDLQGDGEMRLAEGDLLKAPGGLPSGVLVALAGMLAFLVGLGLVALRWAARRLA